MDLDPKGEDELLGTGEGKEVARKKVVKKTRPPWRLNTPYWWRKYQLPTEIRNHHLKVTQNFQERWPVSKLLHDGITSGDKKATREAATAGADVKRYDEHGLAPIHQAILLDHADLIQTLWDNGADIDATTKGTANTTLHLAALNGKYASMRALVRAKARVDLQNEQGQTALHIAAKKGYYEIVKLLLRAGIDTTLTDLEQKTAKDLAEMHDFHELGELLRNFM